MTRVQLIAEIGVNHDGDLERALWMTEAAADAGFDAVKYQYWNVDELLAPDAPTAGYQGPGDQHDLLAGLRIDLKQLDVLERRTHALGLSFIVTPDGERACTELLDLGLDALKIGSGDADNPWLLDVAVSSGLPIIASTGMMQDDEISVLVERLAPVRDVILLHCVSAYPTPLSANGLTRIERLRKLSTRPVGLSDHTVGIVAAAAAIGMGAVTIEKHVTWSTAAAGPDHAMSLPLDAAAEWVENLRDLVVGLGNVGTSVDEAANRPVVRKALYLRHAVAAGAPVRVEDIEPLRPLADGIPAGERDRVIGRRTTQSLAGGDLLRWSHLEA